MAMLPVLKLMGLEHHWTEASSWVASQSWANLSIDGSAKLDAYTATKQMIGPLMSAYAFEKDEADKGLRKAFLRRAGELGSLLHLASNESRTTGTLGGTVV